MIKRCVKQNRKVWGSILLLPLMLVAMLLSWGSPCRAQIDSTELKTVEGTAALEHFRVGVEALQTGELDKAVDELSRAVQLQPATDEYCAALSAAYLANKRINASWKFARRAVLLGPHNPRCTEQLAAAWMAWGRRGTFHVATKSTDIESQLGKPDRVNSAGRNERWIYGFFAIDFADGALFATTDLRGNPPSQIDDRVRLGYQPDPEIWQIRFRTRDQFGFTSEYEAKAGRDAPTRSTDDDHATEQDDALSLPMIIVQRLYGLTSQGVSPRDWMERNRNSTLATNDSWKLVNEDVYGVLFEHTVRGPNQRVTSWEMTRVLKGPRDLFRVSFVAKVRPNDLQTNRWRDVLGDIRVVQRKTEE